ncbi:MAG: glucuronate isomerase [Propionibacteriaceae bacterium]|jgi:glucuronate isomerase|nr:glucuronate isomerase [Propionibacteriaceae bacterium]
MDDRFLLRDDVAAEIYAEIADLPIIDYHSHLDARQLLANQPFENLTDLWLGSDHYKWRLMRANGVPEDLVTGAGNDFAKFSAFAATLEKAVGNPVYEWAHLELRRYFGIRTALNAATAPAIWEQANAALATPDFLPQAILERSRVEVAVTTDDPADDLAAHVALAGLDAPWRVLPSFRPDSYLDDPAAPLDQLPEAMARFGRLGCRTADFGLDRFRMSEGAGRLVELLGMVKSLGWTAQVHFGVDRRQNLPMTQVLGPNTGFDSIGAQAGIVDELRLLLQLAHEAGKLPDMILYPLNPADWPVAATLLGNFQSESVRLQLGAAWWFNDHVAGIRRQLETLATTGLLGNFTGMLTDSRSLLSYARHDYFRRILATHLAQWHAAGRVGDLDLLKQVARDVSYHNAKRRFA